MSNNAAPRVEFHFDFGSPNAYLSHRLIPQIEARTRVTFVYADVKDTLMRNTEA